MTTSTSPIATTDPTTGEVVREFAPHTPQYVQSSIRDAHVVWERWRDRPVQERAAIVARASELLLERREELARLVSLEMGKLVREARDEITLAASILAYYAEHGPDFIADRELPQESGSATIVTRPIGVVLAVEPWNFPWYQAMRAIAPNLVAGNVVLLKHASINPQSAMAIEKLFADAGAPAHVMTTLLVTADDVAPIIEHEHVRGVMLTGSEGAGRSVAKLAGSLGKRSVLELGGSDPFLVLEDADLDAAIEAAVAGRMANAGQVCTSPKRMIVVGDERYEAFVSGLVTAMAELQAGDLADDATTIAPLSSEGAVEKLAQQVEDAIEQGARCVLGGHRMGRAGWYFEPTVLVDIAPHNVAYREELFGPVAMVYRARDEDDAVRIANDTRFGLGATIMARDTARAERLARRIDCGMVWINQPTGSQPDLPFGGAKASGYGRELGPWGMDEFVTRQLVRTVAGGGDANASGATG